MNDKPKRPTWKQTDAIKDPEAFYKSKEEWKAVNDGANTCHICKKQVLEADGMNGRDGRLIHEACYEPGDPDNY